MKNTYILFVFLFFVMSCQTGLDQNLLVGKWQAAEFTNNGQQEKIFLEKVQFEFTKEGKYSYNGMFKDKEAGTFRLRGKTLYTTNTLEKGASEKAVKITLLTADSLHFLMNAAGQEQELKLFKLSTL